VALQSNAVAANVYAASLAGGRFGYRWFRPALVLSALAVGALVVATDALAVEDLALLLASVFLPLFAVVLARNIIASAPYALSWIAWAAGVVAYGWINPGDFAPWHDTMRFIFSTVLHAPFPLGGELTPWPASVVSFVVAAGGYLLAASAWRLGSRASEKLRRAA
jgi:hypothetical protein